jgi:hypothetical protein
LLQFFGAAFFSVNYFMLGATVGGLLNLIGAIRAIVFLFQDRFRADHIFWFVVFVSSYVVVYLLNFIVFSKQITILNLLIELLPVLGMTALNIGFRLKKAADVRKCALVSSPSWLIYNIVAGSWGAIACEIFTLVSVIVGMIRYDFPARKEKKKAFEK